MSVAISINLLTITIHIVYYADAQNITYINNNQYSSKHSTPPGTIGYKFMATEELLCRLLSKSIYVVCLFC